jgi:hypothetical protein
LKAKFVFSVILRKYDKPDVGNIVSDVKVLSSTRRFDFGRELLKIIAIATMVIDHVGNILYPDLLYLRIIGRLAFPIFAYLIVLGVESTKKPRKYMATLLFFALISQLPYFLAFGIQPFERLNILFSLFLSAVTIYFYNKRSPIAFLPLLLSIILPTEGSYYVVLTAVGMKLLMDAPKIGALLLFALNLQFPFISSDIDTQIQILSLFALPLIFLHIKGWLKKEILIPENSLAYTVRKYAFYILYPLHLALIFLIKLFFF